MHKYPLEDRDSRGDYFRERCPACDPLAQRRRQEDRSIPLESCDSLLRYERHVSENQEIAPEQLCLGCQLFGSTRRGSRLIVEDASYAGDGLPVYKMHDFLAIDRFTGGGAEGFKFDALALWKPGFRARIFLGNPEKWEVGWLTLVLRDLAEGWLRVGFGASKGFGKVTVTEGDLCLASLDQDRIERHEEDSSVSVYTVKEQPLLEWKQASPWVEAFTERIAEFEREENLELPADSYFGVVDEIYGGEAR
jgi:CRISPR/Cas system CSM-associated protein Csm3 (group 7 of RAMP superfamily)